MKTFRRILFTSVFISLSLPMFAGWVIRTTDTEGAGTMVMMFQNGKMRMDMGDMVSIIINTGNNTMTWISHPSKKYWSGTAQEFKKQQKAMIREMTGMDPDKVGSNAEEKSFHLQIEKIESGDILGFKVDHFKVSESGNLKEELWIAPDVTVTKEVDWKKLTGMLEVMSGDLEKDYSSTSEYESLMMSGYPLKTIEYADGEAMVNGEAESVEKKNLPASMFALPGGYDQVTILSEFYKYMYGQQ
ncbi:MAG: DUF4412 domain-containing protein [Chlorobi bacterium]|nr:DUF4412 domain-containing protein [Chlorobiota bacterium]